MDKATFDKLVHRATDAVYERLRKLNIPAGLRVVTLWGRDDPVTVVFRVDYGIWDDDKSSLHIAILTGDGKLRFLVPSPEDPDVVDLNPPTPLLDESVTGPIVPIDMGDAWPLVY